MPIPSNNYGNIQAFAPNRIVTAASLDTSGVLAVRVSESVLYRINNAGVQASMPSGVTAVAEGVTSFNFSSSITIEVMDLA
ncbi:hypothetical protein [Neptunomonas sp.]|uniref:hypothetical protein n=1 Tax=Neptunomonas TaxID=75687 RepID=UPI00351796FF